MTSISPASDQRTPTSARALSVDPATDSRGESGADYRASHSVLLTDLYGAGRPTVPSPGSPPEAYGPLFGDRRPDTGHRVGGIVVPTCRDFAATRRGLDFAAEIAARHGCSLIVVYSRDAHPQDVSPQLRERLGDALVLVDLEQVDASWSAQLASSEDELSGLHRSNDVGRKRNLGLVLAARFGWEFVLFLDDDVWPAQEDTGAHAPTLSPEHLAHAVRAMRADDDLRAVGWPLVAFDDNSVVGHARPLVGLPQDIFISSGALLLRMTEEIGFFPEGIYNEDWLLLIQILGTAPDYQRALARGGPVRQNPYPAFCPRRARSEEAGEILGEGLMNLVEDHGPGFPGLMSGRYWKRVMAGRRSLLRRIVERYAGGMLVWEEQERPRSEDPVVVCMNTALWTHRQLSARKLANYARKWWDDHERWQSLLVSLSDQARAADPEWAIADLLARPRAVPGQLRSGPRPVVACQRVSSRSASTTDRGREITD